MFPQPRLRAPVSAPQRDFFATQRRRLYSEVEDINDWRLPCHSGTYWPAIIIAWRNSRCLLPNLLDRRTSASFARCFYLCPCMKSAGAAAPEN